MRVIVWRDLIIGGDDIAFCGIEGVGQLIEWNVTCPLVLVRPAGDGERAVALCANRNVARHLIRNIAFHVRV